MSQSVPMQPGIGYPPDGQVELLRKLVWNTWHLAGGGGGSGVPGWVAVPASSSAAGNPGNMAYDGDYLYVCVQNAQWRRVAINDWA
jgi:hypothetical protein